MHLKFSHDIKSLLEKLSQQPLTLSDILAGTSERGFSLVIALLVLPFLFPHPPGFTGIPGIACLILSLQMALGRRSPWLPKKVAQFKFPRWFAQQLLQNLKRCTRLLERIVRPRMLKIAGNPYIWQFNGFCIAWLAILLMLPIPLTNSFPTIGILVLAVATLEDDGLLMCVSYIYTIVITLIFAFLIYALWRGSSLLPSLFQ
ncbi:exopolysaccharide biosynthesis protein [Chroococcidiopsis cubana CCALA 043]|nr:MULTISPECIES: exopolysaccharide biosynthesis protein [Chroococcidiopsis]PSB47169.1 exopolysaccharide biosynthesis protein [Cyanosarcina cf. burmensis CCALA 770]PSB58188.1 exopolysaccharide biosynthesis protein [Chroococcidiopsis cubana CCALA 043]URD51335.1 exopolysaccharide biosynthesis protein [Chroococcidiopsis sp. CCNUC1]